MHINPITVSPVSRAQAPKTRHLVKSASQCSVEKSEIESVFNNLLFRKYVLAKNYRTKYNMADFKELYKYNGLEFVKRTCSYLAEKLAIPQVMKPAILNIGENKNSYMSYDLSANHINVSNEALKTPKTAIAGMLRHELQHLIQNMDINRHETFGEDMIKAYSSKGAIETIKSFDNFALDIPEERIKEVFGEDKFSLNIIMRMKKLIAQNDNDAYKKYLREVYKELSETNNKIWEFRRQSVIAEKGFISKDSKIETKRIEGFVNNIFHNPYL